jgi:hypothetical protein
MCAENGLIMVGGAIPLCCATGMILLTPPPLRTGYETFVSRVGSSVKHTLVFSSGEPILHFTLRHTQAKAQIITWAFAWENNRGQNVCLKRCAPKAVRYICVLGRGEGSTILSLNFRKRSPHDQTWLRKLIRQQPPIDKWPDGTSGVE